MEAAGGERGSRITYVRKVVLASPSFRNRCALRWAVAWLPY